MRKLLADEIVRIKPLLVGIKHIRDVERLPIVFIGETFALAIYDGGSYSAGGRQSYTAPFIRFITFVSSNGSQNANGVATDLAAKSDPDLYKAVRAYPRSDKQARELLENCRKLDALAVSLLPAAHEQIAEKARARDARYAAEEAAARRLSGFKTAEADILAEVKRLLDEGLLDGSNMLAALRDAAVRRRDNAD